MRYLARYGERCRHALPGLTGSGPLPETGGVLDPAIMASLFVGGMRRVQALNALQVACGTPSEGESRSRSSLSSGAVDPGHDAIRTAGSPEKAPANRRGLHKVLCQVHRRQPGPPTSPWRPLT